MVQPPSSRIPTATTQSASIDALTRSVGNMTAILRELDTAFSRHHARVLSLLTQSAGAPQVRAAQLAFNVEYLRLVEKMQNENRQFTSVSNVMKTKQDTTKNTVNNVR